jgi:hypothetical protein
MSKLTYYLVESNPLEEDERSFSTLARAQAALAERVTDLVADDFEVTGRTDYSARLVDAQGESVSLHIVEATVEPLTLTDCTGWSREQFESFLA